MVLKVNQNKAIELCEIRQGGASSLVIRSDIGFSLLFTMKMRSLTFDGTFHIFVCVQYIFLYQL